MDDLDSGDIRTLIDQLLQALTTVANSQEHPGMNVLTAIVMQEFGMQQSLVWEEPQIKNGIDPAIIQAQVANLRRGVKEYIIVVDEEDER